VTGRRRAALAAAALALMQGVLLLRTAWDKSDTGDEPVYIGAAALLWAHRDYTYNNPAPVLPKWAYAVALRVVDPWIASAPPEWSTVISHMLWARRTERLRANLFAARSATVLVTVLGGLLLWAAARRFGEGAALVTHALWCVSPSILANGALATLDGWVAAMMCLVLWTGVRLHEQPTLRRFGESGAALGLALACKVTALGVAPMLAVVGVAALRRQGRTARALWPAAAEGLAVSAGVTFVVMWSLYGLTVGPVSTELLAERFGWTARTTPPLPMPAWIAGLLHQWALGSAGHRTYLFGEVRTHGWWWFYLAAVALKTTIGAQALGLFRLVSWMRARPLRASLLVDAALLAYPALLFVFMSRAPTQTGIRYLLPAFPFVMAWLGRALPDLSRAFGRGGRVAALACVVASAVESLSVHPHHLMFFNRWAGGPVGGPRYMILSDDWGQDQRRLGEWIRERGLPGVFYTFYTGMPRKWGVEYRPPPCAPRRGVYALHAVEVHRPRRIERGCLDWLTVEPPDERIGYSIYIYHVNKERLDRLVAARGTPSPFWRSGAPPVEAP
jgi:hypothetical protein